VYYKLQQAAPQSEGVPFYSGFPVYISFLLFILFNPAAEYTKPLAAYNLDKK